MNAVTDITGLAHITCPDALRDLPAWVCWRYEPNDNPGGKPRKVPYYAGGGRRQGVQGRPEDRHQLVTFDAARAAAARRKFDGVGFAPLPDMGICALDFDDCVTGGRIHPEVLALLPDTYAEFSPSGNGIRAFFRGALGNMKDSPAKPFGFETFSSKGFVTFTGQVLDIVELMGNANEVAPLSPAVLEMCRRRFTKKLELAAATQQNTDTLGLTPAQIDQCLEVLPNDLPYEDSDGPSWIGVGMALHHETSGAGFDIWDAWSSKSPKYTSREYGLARWNSFGKNAGGPTATARSLVHWANEHGAHITLHGPASAEEFDAVASAGAPPADPAAPKPPRFTPVPMADFANAKALNWTVKGILPRAALVVLFGDSGSGKTFVTLQIAAAVARGVPWRGRKVRQGRVVYVCAEGRHGFAMRGAAYAAHEQVPWADVPLDVIADAPNLMLKEDALALAKAIGKADLVVVDTLAQTMPGGNENAGEDVGRVLAHCQGLHRATGATVLLVHHSGKDASKGARGWSGLRAAADAELEVIRTPTGRMLRTGKEKDGPDDIEFGFALEVVALGMDEDGDPITSCAVVEAQLPTARVVRTLGAVEQVVNDVIQEMAQAQTSGIEVEAVLKEAVKRMPEPEDRKRDTRRMRARRALKALCEGDDAPYLEEDGCLSVV